MATIAEAQEVIAEMDCPLCLAPGQVMYAILAVIDAINRGEPVPSTPSELMQAAKCFECTLSPGMVPYAILASLMQLGSGGAMSQITCGTEDPVAAPLGNCALYYRTDTGSLWMWNGAAWVALIV